VFEIFFLNLKNSKEACIKQKNLKPYDDKERDNREYSSWEVYTETCWIGCDGDIEKTHHFFL
jgi:hypothetical protein